VDVWGQRREKRLLKRAGTQTIITPQDPSRFDLTTHLQEHSNTVVKENGRPTPSGFVLPSIRGHEEKLTALYLEGVSLHDPFTGLPIIGDLDLRAFGRMEIAHGVSDPSIPSLNPVGTIRYRLAPISQKQKVGLQYGKPFGTSLWGLASASHKDDFAIQLYGRDYRTDGAFAFYDDNATPYNENDDRISWRTNNDRHARQLIPIAHYNSQFGKTTVIAMTQRSEAGLPGAANAQGLAREEKFDDLGIIKHAYTYNGADNTWLPSVYTLTGQSISSSRSTNDSTGSIFGSPNRSTVKTKSKGMDLTLQHIGDIYDLYHEIGKKEAQVTGAYSQLPTNEFSRSQSKLYSGLSLDLPGSVLFEIKQEFINQEDHYERLEDREKKSVSRSFSTAWSPGFWRLYTQVANYERLNSLIEEFGDGSYIQPSDQLRSEHILHREAGIAINPWSSWTLSLNHYRDDARDKVRFLPGIGQTLKATNIDQAKIEGTEVSTKFSRANHTISLGWSKTRARDLGYDSFKQLVGIPETQTHSQYEYRFGTYTSRLSHRYRSPVFRDRANSILIPEASIYDASIDAHYHLTDLKWLWGLQVNNLTDVKGIPISAPETPANRGKTSYSDYSGFPLPGRTWKLSTAVEL
jgi:hypothetical protein